MDRQPLADKYRPQTLDDVVGQLHLIQNNSILCRIIKSKNIPNMVFYGPSGTGKTTIANIIANQANKKIFKLNATTAGIADIRKVISESDKEEEGIILYLDEIQYFNKKQQQSLLEFIESGQITLIASTTENPYFYLFNAILSRSTIFEFKPIDANDIKENLIRIISKYEKDNNVSIEIGDKSINSIANTCGGDVRKSLNALELLLIGATHNDDKIIINDEDISLVSQKSSLRYDKDGDEHYDILSAFQKSIRGSDPNAALHYLARLIVANDLVSICRRLMVIAAEDIGLAYPQAITIVKSCVDSANMLGFPEARIPLAEATILLATSPKSNSAITGIDAAIQDIQNGNYGDIPSHLKDAHYQGATKLGRGTTYQFPHLYPNHWVQQQYLPDKIKNVEYYHYGDNKFENSTKLYWEKIHKGLDK